MESDGTDFETFYINVHFRPSMYCAKVMNAHAARKHPLYTYLML